MATGKITYASAVAITITPGALADGSARESTAVDNSTNLYVDAVLYVAVTLASGTPSGDKKINVYGYASHDGTNYTDNATGADAAITLRSPSNLQLFGSIATPDSGALEYKGVFPSVALGLRGTLPTKWGIVLENQTGVAFSATTVEYTGIHSSVV